MSVRRVCLPGLRSVLACHRSEALRHKLELLRFRLRSQISTLFGTSADSDSGSGSRKKWKRNTSSPSIQRFPFIFIASSERASERGSDCQSRSFVIEHKADDELRRRRRKRRGLECVARSLGRKRTTERTNEGTKE